MSSPQKIMVGCRVDPSWKDQIDRLAESNHSTSSSIIESAIAQYLGIGTGESPLSRLDAIEERLARLETSESLDELRNAIADLQQFRDRLKRKGF